MQLCKRGKGVVTVKVTNTIIAGFGRRVIYQRSQANLAKWVSLSELCIYLASCFEPD